MNSKSYELVRVRDGARMVDATAGTRSEAMNLMGEMAAAMIACGDDSILEVVEVVEVTTRVSERVIGQFQNGKAS